MRRGLNIGIIIIAAIAAVLAYGYGQTYALRATSDIVASKDLPKSFSGTKIVFATDFHCGFFYGSKRIGSVAEKINSLNPDIIILGGDYIESGSSYVVPCFEELAKLKAPLGIFAVLGNRDYQNSLAGDIRQAMEKANITLLENSGVWIAPGSARGSDGARIRVGGIADVLRSNPNLSGALDGAVKNDFDILAAHNPSYGQIADPMVDLALSGHTHGGQVTLFGLRPLPWQWGWRYSSGIYNNDRTTIIVSNGVGTRLIPVRLFVPPEINLITLRAI